MNLKLSVPKGVDIDSVSFSLPFDIDKKAENANGHLTATKDKLTVYYDDKAVREFAVSDISKITVEQLIGWSMLCVRDMHGKDICVCQFSQKYYMRYAELAKIYEHYIATGEFRCAPSENPGLSDSDFQSIRTQTSRAVRSAERHSEAAVNVCSAMRKRACF